MKQVLMQCAVFILIALGGHVQLWAQETTATNSIEEQRHVGTDVSANDVAEERTSGTTAIVASSLPLERVASAITFDSGIPVAVKGQAAGLKVSLMAPKKMPVADLLELLANTNPDLLVRKADPPAEGYEIWSANEYEVKSRIVRVYDIHEGPASALEDVIEPLLTPRLGTVNADNRLDKLVVYDTPERQEHVEKLLNKLNEKLMVRVFSLGHAKPAEVERHLVRFCHIDGADLSSDEATNQLFVRGTTSTLQQAEFVVDAVDVPPVSTRDSRTAPRQPLN